MSRRRTTRRTCLPVTIDNRSGLPAGAGRAAGGGLSRSIARRRGRSSLSSIPTPRRPIPAARISIPRTRKRASSGVGQAIADALNARGIPAVHETSLIDLGNYNDAYPRMAGLAEDWLARYPSIQMVLDVHRDSLETDDGTQLALRADVDGEACAKLLLVMGSNGSGLEHPAGGRIWPTPPTCRPCASSARRPHARFAAARLAL